MMDAMEVSAALRRAAEKEGCALNTIASEREGCPDCSCAECCKASAKWANDAADAIERCAMPGGVEWPRFDDGRLMMFGDRFVTKGGDADRLCQVFLGENEFSLYGEESEDCWAYGERVKRPVMDADGVPIRVGDTVWDVRDAARLTVQDVQGHRDSEDNEALVWAGDTTDDGIKVWRIADQLTHTKPEPPDSWERLEEDANVLAEAEANGRGSYNAANDYCNARGLEGGTVWVLMARDLVRRARALAERGER